MEYEDVDVAKVYLGDDIVINEYIVIHQPTITEIIRFGEVRFWNFISIFCANSTSMRLSLWKAGYDWNKITDFQLFSMLLQSFDKDVTKMIFGNLDFGDYVPFDLETDDGKEKLILIHRDDPLNQIDEETYKKFMSYMRVCFDYHPKTEWAKNKVTKLDMIDEEETKIRNAKRLKQMDKDKFKSNSIFLPIMSFLLNYPGFKYKKEELNHVRIFEFMDAVKRIQSSEMTLALMSGMYSGMLDTSKIPNLNQELNLTRDLD